MSDQAELSQSRGIQIDTFQGNPRRNSVVSLTEAKANLFLMIPLALTQLATTALGVIGVLIMSWSGATALVYCPEPWSCPATEPITRRQPQW